jgi:hypothetical protein
VRVVAHERPRIEGALPGGRVFAELADESPPVRIVGKQMASVNPPNNDVMKGAESI